MFERPQSGERAVLVHVTFNSRILAEDIQEFTELAHSAGAYSVATVSGVRKKAEPKYLIGLAKAQEVQHAIEENSANLVLIDHPLTPAQERNLEKLLNCRVLDRNGLILDIFAQRASSHEGRLQVELAQLQHLSTRLVRGWTHLERQKGGIGLRGPGETQLETDRRLLGNRIKQLNKRLAKVRNQRQQGRKSRKKAELATVSLVGYTNAGKSTLFNHMTHSHVYAEDQLFATLDPTLRRIAVTSTCAAILADTVGFIRDLPHELVEAFRSTLEETREAELLLHIVDANNPLYHERFDEVNKVLKEIGASKIPQIQVFNKIDQIPGAMPRIEYDEAGCPTRVWVSAKTGAGLDLLLDGIAYFLEDENETVWLRVSGNTGFHRSRIFSQGDVLDEKTDPLGQDLLVQAKFPRKRLQLLLKNKEISIEPIDHTGLKPVINSCG